MMKSIQCISFYIIYCAVRVLEPNTHTYIYTRVRARFSYEKYFFSSFFHVHVYHLVSFRGRERNDFHYKITK